MRTIIAIGGGNIVKGETLAIDKEIIARSGKKKPKLLFIPTASSDSEGYVNIIKDYFGKKLHCSVDVLYLIKEIPSKTVIAKKIARKK